MNEDELSNIIVIKRSGKRVAFDATKIAIAVKKGFDSIDGKYDEEDINKVYNKVVKRVRDSKLERIKIDQIQDWIEEELRDNQYDDVYNSFKIYREKRNKSRGIFFEEKRKHKFLKALEKLGLNSKNSVDENLDNRNSIEKLQAYGKAVAEEFATSYLIKSKFSDGHENGDIFIKDLENYPIGTTESINIDLEKLFVDGFETEKCSIREPQSIVSYATLAIIAICNNQRDQSGEQSIPAFDYYMAPGVLKTFKKEFKQTIYDILEYTDFDKFIAINGIEREIEKINTIDFDISQFYKFTRDAEELKRMFRIVYDKALFKTNKHVYQAMEGFVHDLNSICDGKTTTINLGTDTSKEGRMIIKNMLITLNEGVGENKQAISPKVVFKVKKGVNYDEHDANNDLLKMACETATKTNNILFSFQDTQFNSQFYKEGDYNTEVAYFQDGTRVIDNLIYKDKQFSQGRGVLSSTVLNLPRIALKHRENLDDFYDELVSKVGLVCEQLVERLEIQSNKKAYNFPFLMKQNVWIDSEKIRDDDRVRRILKQGVLKVGITGLNECVLALTGKELNENKKSQVLGLEIVNRINDELQKYCSKYNCNFLLAGTDDDDINKDFIEFDRIIFGKIKSITDKEKYTSSFEVLNEKNINKKIELEAPFHEILNGGHKFKVDLKLSKKDADKYEELIKILKLAYKNEIGLLEVFGAVFGDT